MVAGEFQTLLFGLQLGVTFMLIAAGLTLILGMMDVMNIAHGSFYMLGGFVGYSFVSTVGNFWLGLLLVPIIVGAFGGIVEVLLLRPLYGRDPVYHLLLTLGILFIIQNAVRIVWGPDFRQIAVPEILSGSLIYGDFTYPIFRLFVLVLGLAVMIVLWAILRYTKIGLVMRASALDSEMADALGLDVSKVYTGVFMVGTSLAAFAGFLIGAQNVVHTQMDVDIVILAFAIIVIGGLKSFRGAVVGSLIAGFLISFGGLIIPSYTNMIVYALMLIVLIVRPTGLFGQEVSA